MALAFPASIRSELLKRGYSVTARDVVERTQPDLGPVMTHQRFTKAERVWTGTLRQATAADAATFDAHFESVLGFGALPGDWVEPDTGATVSVLIKKVDGWKQMAGVTREIQLELTEVLS